MPDRPHLPRRHGPDRLPPDEEERVRRLLAEARHDEPLPDDVASRLDGVLAGLAAEPRRAATVHRLAHRRRRAATVLVAAAAVVVAGVSLGQLVGGGGTEEAARSGSEETVAELDRDGPPEAGAVAPEAEVGTLTKQQRTDVVRVRAARFAVDVTRLRDRLRRPAAAQESARDDLAPGCDPGEWGPGTYQPVRYGGSEGYVVLRPAQGEIQVADLFLCGSDQVQRSVTLPGP